MKSQAFGRKGGLILAALCGSALVACYPTGAPPLPGIQLSVPFIAQVTDGLNQYCASANVQMWQKYRNGSVYESQPDIWNWVATHYPAEAFGYGTLSPNGTARAATHYVGVSISAAIYDQYQKRQAIADQKMGIYRHDPTIVITDQGFHSVIVKGAYWHQLTDLQPSADYMYFHDPALRSSVSNVLSYWMDTTANSCSGYCIQNIQRSTQYWSGQAALQEFDAWGGTYYGDPNPPDGCSHCPKEATNRPLPFGRTLRGLLAFFFHKPEIRLVRTNVSDPLLPKGRAVRTIAQGSAPQSRGPGRGGGVRGEVYVPFPHGTTPEELTENFWAGIDQTRMYLQPGWEQLTPPLREVHLSQIEHVRSLSRHPDYYLLSLTVGTSGRQYGRAMLSEEGWLMAVTVYGPESFRSSFDGSRAIAAVLAHRPGEIIRHNERVYAVGNASSIERPLHPFYAVSSDTATFYVDEQGSVFTEALPKPGAHVMLLKDGRPRALEHLR